MNDELEQEKTELEEYDQQLPLPLGVFEPSKEVRPDYNIGKYAGVIFTSPYSKTVREVREYPFAVKRGDQSLEGSLTVTPLHGLKTPTTTTLRVYLALLQVWEHMGFPEDGVVRFSARQLAEVIGWRWGGTDTANRIYEHLRILMGTSLDWIFLYTQKDKTVDEIRTGMSILASSDYRKRKHLWQEDKFSTVQRVRINPDLVESMLAGHVRPLNYEAFQQISNDTTANLYMRLDMYLHRKSITERTAYGLLTEDLGLTGKRYEKRFARKAKLKEFVEELDGKPLFTGVLRLSIKETADGKDWKLVARKEAPAQSLEAPKKPRPMKPANSDEDAELLAEELIFQIRRSPRPGHPKRDYIKFLCKLYPANLMRRALSTAKADYLNNVHKTLTHVFVYETKRLVVMTPKLRWYDPEDEQVKALEEGKTP